MENLGVSQLSKHLTLDWGSDHDLGVIKSRPHVRLHTGHRGRLLTILTPSFPPPSLSPSKFA